MRSKFTYDLKSHFQPITIGLYLSTEENQTEPEKKIKLIGRHERNRTNSTMVSRSKSCSIAKKNEFLWSIGPIEDLDQRRALEAILLSFRMIINRKAALIRIAQAKDLIHVSYALEILQAEIEWRNKFATLALLNVSTAEMAELLLRNGASMGFKDGSGRTALHFAAQNGREEVVMTLLQSGADTDALNNHGLKPIHVAKTLTIAKMLLRYC